MSSLGSVLITGGCGFIGSHLVQHLLEQDPAAQIHVLDIDTKSNRFPSVAYHECDISSTDDVSRTMQAIRPRVIFHVASPNSMVPDSKLFEKVNLGGTRNILSVAAKIGIVQALVFTSSSSVIHDNVTDLIEGDETLPILRPPAQKRVYTLTKATAEEEVIAANRKGGNSSMFTVSLRPCTTIGEADTVCLGKMIPIAEQGKTRFQMGNGKNIYDFVYAGNLVDAHILAAQALVKAWGKCPPPANQRVDGESINITNDERVLFWDFNRKVAAEAGYLVKKEEIWVIPLWVGLAIGWISELVVWALSGGTRQPNMTVEGIRFSTINRTLRVDKAKRVLGYRPKVSIDEGIQRGVTWYKENKKKPA
ncbi:hypothetical protein MMC28_008438 [Mycoblastus sanguinarius]|nr:hypothetical protein [Mycoblastus sanguinarius]